MIFNITRAVARVFCLHHWKEELIFSGGRNTHHDIRSCYKCGKSEKLFSGSRAEWYAHNGHPITPPEEERE